MLRYAGVLIFIVLGFLCGGREAFAQDSTGVPDSSRTWHDAAWTPIVTRSGLTIGYLFYREADNENNGVVLRLQNRNDYAVHYEFTVIFRGPNAEATDEVEGRLGAREMKTGDNAGLFWIPFKKGARVGEVGLRGIEVTPIQPKGAHDEDKGSRLSWWP